ncbi:MAG: DNA cytosine methyltransferase, partial [Candidatus Thorarchaeota archaeon]
MYKVLDLFCGAGGFSHGIASIFKGEHLAIELDPFPLETYSHNYPHTQVIQSDISSLHANEILEVLGGPPDIIIASPPCEEYSLANPTSSAPAIERIYGTGSARLLLDTIRLISDLSPRAYIIENVAALMKNGGRDIALREFHRAGIEEVHFNLVRSHQNGNPSKRLRLFISNIKFSLPKRNPPTVMETIGDLPSLEYDAIFSCPEPMPNHVYNTVSDEKLKQIRKTAWGKGAKHFRASQGKTMPNWVRLYPNRYATSIIGLSRYI